MTVVLIAADMADGRAWCARQPCPPQRTVVITPRSPDGCRGLRADAVLITEAAAYYRRLDALLAVAMPCVATR